MTRRQQQLICLNIFWVFMVLFGIGWAMFARFIPPPSPAASAEEIATMFRENTFGIRIGMVISIFSATLLLPWGGAICGQLRRLDGPHGIWLWSWIMAQACLLIEFIYPCAFWGVAAFRPEDAARIQYFNDLAWLPFISIVGTVIYQAIAIAVLTLSDKREIPVYPRWFGFFQLWCALGMLPGSLIYLFKTGPFAWDGILAFWVGVGVGFLWMGVTTVMTARAIKNEPEDEAPDPIAVGKRLAAVEAELAALRSGALR